MPIIRGERVYLRGSERSDIPLFVQWFNDAETAGHISARAPMSQVGEEAWFVEMAAQQGKSGYHFVMCRIEDDEPFGTIGLFDLDLLNGSAGIGITIGEKSLWGRGYGTDAMLALLDFGFGQLRLERMWLEVYDYNQRAIRSYEKCGFVLEGTQRRAVYKHGRFIDVHLMAIVHDEWAGQERRRMWEYEAR
jgi:RimJ/RimL family protein N-acetyltransferase